MADELTREQVLSQYGHSAMLNAICDAALAHLDAKERGVQGWAVVGPDGSIEEDTVSSTKDRAWNASRIAEFNTMGYTCQPVTITINAAGQGNGGERGSVTDSQESPTRERCPAPAAPASESAEHHFQMTKEEVVRIRNKGWSNPWPKVWNRQLSELCDAYEKLRAIGAQQNSEQRGIRKGLETAIAACEAMTKEIVCPEECAAEIRALLDAERKKEGV